MTSEKVRATFDEDKQRRFEYWVSVNNAALYSLAFKKLKFGPTIKVYLWAKMKGRVLARKEKNRLKKLGQPLPPPEPFSFPFDEAELFGLTRKQFARAIRDLVKFGFWDVVRKGGKGHNDYSLYAWSDRWTNFGTDNFLNVQFPSNLRHLPRNPNGRWDSNRSRPTTTSSQTPMADLRNRDENCPG